MPGRLGLNPSSMENFRPEFPSPSHPRARWRSSALRLRPGGVISIPAKPCLSSVNVGQCLEVYHVIYLFAFCRDIVVSGDSGQTEVNLL